MPYPRRLLHDDEEIIFELRPHPIRICFPVFVTAVTFGVEGFGYVAWRGAPGWFAVALGAVAVVAAGYLVGRLLAWRTTLFVLTTRRVIYRHGVVRRVGREIPLDRVQDVTYVQRLGARLIGAGSVLVESAGSHGGEPIPDVRRPEWVQREINAAIVALHRLASPQSSVLPARLYDQGREVGAELAELAQLRDRGVLTDGEFEEKKRELLDRM
jgi:uncharacterized membrane protein YdbT with pleckstrin-like domain